MIAVGYLAKEIAQRPYWLDAPGVKDIYSVSNCVSKEFIDYVGFWRHNGYWFFDNPDIIRELARENGVDLDNSTFFYYEVYEYEFDDEVKKWIPFEPEDFPTMVTPPTKREFHGYDVVSFSVGTSPECSPLSCNYLADEIKTNAHCLLESFEEAKEALEAGKFDQSEPGPYRIFAVYTIDPNHWLDKQRAE